MYLCCLCASNQQVCSRRPIQAPTDIFPPNESAGLSARSCVTSQVHEAILRAIFCPSRASSQYFSQAPSASRSQHRLSCFLLTKYGSRGCNAVGCANTNGHRPTNTRIAAVRNMLACWLFPVCSLLLKSKSAFLQVDFSKHGAD